MVLLHLWSFIKDTWTIINNWVTERGNSFRAWLSLFALIALPVTIILLWKDFQLFRATLVPIELDLKVRHKIDNNISLEVWNKENFVANNAFISSELYHLDLEKRNFEHVGIDIASFPFIHSEGNSYQLYTNTPFPIYGKITTGCRNCITSNYLIYIDTINGSISKESFYTENIGNDNKDTIQINENEYFEKQVEHIERVHSKYKKHKIEKF